MQCDAATRLGEEEEDGDEQWDVSDALDALDPAPADGLVDEAGVDGRGDGAEDGHPREHGHGPGALVWHVHVVEGAADEDGADAAEDAEEQSQADDGADRLAKGKADEKQVKAEEGAGVNDLATDKLAEGCEDHGCERTSNVKSEEAHLTKFGRSVQVFYHTGDTGAVGGGGKTDEEGHEIEHGGDTSLLPFAPLVWIFLVACREGENNVFFLVVHDHFRQRERHVNALDSLDGAAVCVDRLIRWVDIFPAHDPSYERLAFLVPLDVVLMAAHNRQNIRRGLVCF